MNAPALPSSVGEQSPAPQFSVETISDFQSFLGLEKAWNDLVEEAGVEHPFLSHEWVRTWWECFGAGKQLHILVVRAGSEPVAIAPLMRSVGRMYGLKVRRLQCISNDHTPRFDFIVARWQQEAYRAIWASLLEQRALWDVLQMAQVPGGSRTLEELPKLAADSGFLVGLWPSTDSPYVPVGGSWDSYLKGRSSKHRSNLRNRLKRLSGLGQVELKLVSSGEELGEALEDGLRIEAMAWKGSGGTAIRCRPEIRRLYTMLAERSAQRGWLRLQFLTVDGRRIAFGYSLCHKNRLYLLKPGYDPEYARYSPFNLLCYMALQEAFERGLTEYDFLGVDDEWKLEWTGEKRPHYWLFVFPHALRMRLLYWIKFRLVPRFQRHRLYVSLRDLVSGWRKGFPRAAE